MDTALRLRDVTGWRSPSRVRHRRNMLLRSLLAVACLAPLVSSTKGNAGAELSAETSLAKLRDTARPLLIFAPRPEGAELLTQLRLLDEHADEMKERDVIAIALPASGLGATSARLTNAEAEAARQRFHIRSAEFVVILLGKDGGEKLRSRHPLSTETLKKLIDAMPMRRDEMRSAQNSLLF